jgi:myo-inositol-1-phosphate synthase
MLGDSKRAMDEYYTQIFMGGRNTLAIHNTCEDSLLAAPLILDLCILTELLSRIHVAVIDDVANTDIRHLQYQSIHPILGCLGYFLKAPVFPMGRPVIHALFRQRRFLENILRAAAGLGAPEEPFLEALQ